MKLHNLSARSLPRELSQSAARQYQQTLHDITTCFRTANLGLDIRVMLDQAGIPLTKAIDTFEFSEQAIAYYHVSTMRADAGRIADS